MGAAIAALVLSAQPTSMSAPLHAGAAIVLACAAIHDAQTRRIENSLVATIVALRVLEIALLGVRDGLAAAASALGSSAAAGTALLAALALMAYGMERATGSAGIGGGDIKLFSALAFFLGLTAALAIIMLSCAAALVHRARAKAPFAFAPYIAAASFAVLTVSAL